MAAAERLLRDLWPVDVTQSGRVIARRARAFVTTRALYLTEVGQEEGHYTEVALIDPLPAADRGSFFGTGLILHSTAGALHINRTGCRCGATRLLRAAVAPVEW